MSAIWGSIDFSGAVLPEGLNDAMRAPLDKYKIDRFECGARGNAVMGCGIQHITLEAERELLPIFDEEAGIYFTADCMIDNRRELIAELCPGREDIPDGELMYLAYKKLGEDTPARLRGAFSFAAYDIKRNVLTLSVDHASSRVLYYARRGSRLCFGTSIASILAVLPSRPELNRRWLSDYLSMPDIRMITEPRETPYLGIFKVSMRRYVIISGQGEEEKIHWDPLSLPKFDSKDVKVLRAEFANQMRRAAAEISDRRMQTGVYLSSGMDSASVAAVYAEALAGDNRELFGYTSVPETGYNARIDNFVTENETDGVMALCALHPNIRPTFFPLEGINAFSNLEDIFQYYESPFKTAPNMMWLYALGERARGDGCRIMLSGQFGNSTISWGSVLDLATELFFRGHYIRAASVLCRYGTDVGLGRKRLLRIWADSVFPRMMGAKIPTEAEFLQGSVVNRRFAEEQNSVRRIIDMGYHGAAPRVMTFSKNRQRILEQDGLSVMGEYETKLGLARGLVIRDITRDKLIWEFCMRLPMECFVEENRDGEAPRDRMLVREGLGEILPYEIGENKLRYGMQSADWYDRLMRNWDTAKYMLQRTFLDEDLREFIDIDEVERLMLLCEEPGREAKAELVALMQAMPMAMLLRG